jgi:hypothetical protein
VRKCDSNPSVASQWASPLGLNGLPAISLASRCQAPQSDSLGRKITWCISEECTIIRRAPTCPIVACGVC